MVKTIHLSTQEADSGTRLDVFISQSIESASRSAVQRWIAAERVSVDGIPRKASFVLTSNQIVVVEPLPSEPTELIAEPISLSILFEDDDLIVVNKPAGLVVHPGAGNWSGTLANALAYHFDQISRQETIRPGIVHRLDKGTSGVILIAKNESAHDFLATQFERREVQKKYLALLYGTLKPPEGEIDLAIGRDPKARTKISPRSARPRQAQTQYQVLRYFEGFTYTEAWPRTGRTHQIRVHFHHLGHPVVGDDTYVRKERLAQLTVQQRNAVTRLDRLFLHAASLRIRHPKSREFMTFEAVLPSELEALILSLGE